MSLLDNLSKLAKTVGDGAASVAKKSGEVVEVAPKEESKGQKCSNCGTELIEGVTFCSACGNKVK